MQFVATRSLWAARFRIMTGIQQRRERNARGAAVILYHAVLPTLREPALETYAVDARTLKEHILGIRQVGTIVALSEIVACLRQGRNPDPRWVAITMDDALTNQVTLAAELLDQLNVPWSLTIPAGLIETGRTIWTYELRFLLHHCWSDHTLPDISETEPTLPFETSAQRLQTLQIIFRKLFDHTPETAREAYLDRLIKHVGRDKFRDLMEADGRFQLATWSQIRDVVQSGVEYLSHGWKHRPHNSTLSAAGMREELEQSRAIIEKELGTPPDGFAFPHGCLRNISLDHAHLAGYGYCVTSEPRRITSDTELMQVPRFAAEFPLPILRCSLTNSN